MANLLSTLITGNLRTTQGYGTSDSTRILYPSGGSFVTTTSVITGAIRIKMPVFGSGMMMTCTVKVYEYSSNKSFTITFGGHRDSDNWYNIFCYFDGDGNRGDLPVRFGIDDGVNCVWIGETSNQWSYPQVFITDVQLGYVGYSTTWLSGWSVGFVTSFGTVNRTATAFQKITTANIGSQSVNYANSAGSATTATNLGADYTADDWIRATADNNPVKFYGNSYQITWRTDGASEAYSGIGAYPFVWTYGGSSASNRRMLMDTSGNLWTNTYGWLHDYFQIASTAITTSNIGSQSVSVARQLLSPNGATVVAADSAMPSAGHSFIHTLALGPSGNDGHILGMTWAGTTSVYGAQIFLDTDPNDIMAIRSRSSTGVWTSWKTIIHSGNIASQSVSYADESGYSSSTGTTDNIGGVQFRNTGSNAGTNADTIDSNGITYYNAGVANFSGNATDGALYSQRYSNSWQHQIAGDYRSGMIAVRGKNNGTWTSWRTIIDSSTIGSQSVSYASSAGNADTVDGYHESAFWRDGQDRRIGTLRFSGEGGNSGNDAHAYAIFQEGGDWSPPFPDLRIAFHTGIKLGANSSYNGIRFYTDYDMSTQVMSVNNGSDPLGGGNVYVNNSLQAGSSLRAPIFYDSNDTTYYGDFASTSWLRHLSVGDVNASNDGSWNARLNLTGSSHARLDVKSNSDGIITTMYSHTGQGVGRVGTMSNHPLAFMVNGSIASGLIWDSTNGSRFVVGESISTPYTLIDSNKRPVIYARGAYPVLTLDHTETGNGVHGPTIQFVHNGLEGRQFVIGTNGTGTQLDFGYSDTPSYGNTSYNPHNGIGGYNGKTIMRLTTTGLLVGDAGTYPTVRTPARDLDVRGSQNISGVLNVNGATEHAINDNSRVVGSSTNNTVFINGSIQLTSNNDAIVIGRGTATFLSDEELGFGWGGGWYMTESSYIRSRGSKSLHMNGGSVDYVGSLYLEGSVGVHLQPNAGSYGSLQVTGSKDGWHGVRFTGSNVVVMANTNEVGFHNNNAGWQFLWSAGTAYVYKGGTGGGTQATVWDSVNAPRANLSDLMHYEGFTLDANSMRSNSTGFTYSNNAPETGPIARFSTGGGYDLWINAGYWSGSDLWFRTRNGDTASINAWRRNLNATSDFYAANMNQYVRTSDSVTFGGVTAPTILVNNQSDNTKGYRIWNTSNTSVSAMFVNSANALVIAAGAVDQVQMNKKVYLNGVALGVNVAPSATAGRIDASNDIVAYSSSDERLKENITPIENALDKVKSLTGVEFDWKPEYKNAHGYEGHDTGIIAQQVQAVMPSAVRTNDTGFLAVRYEKLIGLLIEANKELAARVEELEKKIG